jgi:hypothetical protein
MQLYPLLISNRRAFAYLGGVGCRMCLAARWNLHFCRNKWATSQPDKTIRLSMSQHVHIQLSSIFIYFTVILHWSVKLSESFRLSLPSLIVASLSLCVWSCGPIFMESPSVRKWSVLPLTHFLPRWPAHTCWHGFGGNLPNGLETSGVRHPRRSATCILWSLE